MEYIKRLSNKILPDSKVLENDNTIQINNMIQDSDYIKEIINKKFNKVELLHNDKIDDIGYNIIKSINEMDISTMKIPEKEFDCIITGGGLKGYYVYGSLLILKRLLDLKKIKIRQYTCVSAGAFLSVFILSGLPINIFRRINNFALENKTKYNIDEIMIKACYELLPENIHEILDEKIKILISKASYCGCEQVAVSKFKSKIHLIQILHATCFIPYLTANISNGIKIDDNKYFDGGFSYIQDHIGNNDIPQLVFHTNYVDYKLKHVFDFSDKHPELIVMKGIMEFEQFIKNIDSFDNHHIIKSIPIEWLPSNYVVNRKLNIKKHMLNILLVIVFTITKLGDCYKG